MAKGVGYALFLLPWSIMGALALLIAVYLALTYWFNAIFYLSSGIYALTIGILRFLVKVD